jgi:hypothetical protein
VVTDVGDGDGDGVVLDGEEIRERMSQTRLADPAPIP